MALNIVVEGGAPYEECVNNIPANYTITMNDSWGDGWNGNILNIGGVEYTLDAINDDGSSAFVVVGDCGVAGCMDDTACNYNMDATLDDGTCTYPVTGFDCDGACLSGTAYDVVAGGGIIGMESFMEHY